MLLAGFLIFILIMDWASLKTLGHKKKKQKKESSKALPKPFCPLRLERGEKVKKVLA